MLNTDDEQLLRRIANQDSDALTMLIEKYSGVVSTLVRRILAGTHTEWDVEECVSDVYVRVWYSAQQFQPSRASVRTWLLMMAKYTALDYRRGSNKHLQSGTATGADALTETTTLTSVDSSPVERAVLSREALREVREVLSRLGDLDRQIVYRRFILYEPSEDIALALGTTRRAVDNRLWRIRQTLKEQLKERGEEEFRWMHLMK